MVISNRSPLPSPANMAEKASSPVVKMLENFFNKVENTFTFLNLYASAKLNLFSNKRWKTSCSSGFKGAKFWKVGG